MGNPMDLRRLSGPSADRRFGRRATDAAASFRGYAATFVAQVAGLSLPSRPRTGAYDREAPRVRPGIVTDLKA